MVLVIYISFAVLHYRCYHQLYSFIVTVTLISAFQSFGQIDILTHGGPNDATNLIVYSIYKEAFVNHQFGTASAQAMVLFVFIFVATLLQFKFAERKVHYK